MLPNRRRFSAPPLSRSPIKYDPNANRTQYLQDLGEFKQRGSLYKSTVKKENGESMSAVSENNNEMYTSEIIEFENNCISDSFFGATGNSPPQKFYRNNSNPFPSAMKKQEKVKAKSPIRKIQKRIEDSRQRTCGKIFNYIRTNGKKQSESDSSGAYRQYDLDSSLSDVEKTPKKLKRQDIGSDVYDEIANILGDIVDFKIAHGKENRRTDPSPVNSRNESGLTSYKRCEGVIDDNFRFLNECQWSYFADESASNLTEDRRRNIQITDLDKSTDDYECANEQGKPILQHVNNEAMNQLSPSSVSTVSPPRKVNFFII